MLRANVGFPREMIGNVKLELGEGITGLRGRVPAARVRRRRRARQPLQVRARARRGALPHLPVAAAGDRRARRSACSTCSAAPAATSRPPRSRCPRPWPRPSRSRSTAPHRPAVSPRAEHEPRSLRAPDRHGGQHAATTDGQGAGLAHVPRAESSPPGQAPPRASWSRAPSRGSASRSSAPRSARPGAVARSSPRAGRPAGHAAGPAPALAARPTPARELGVVAGLRKVARDYVAAPYMIGGERAVDPWMSARAGEIEDLCLWLAGEATGDPGPGPGSVAIVAERLGAFTVDLGAGARGVGLVVVGGNVETDSLAAGLARAAQAARRVRGRGLVRLGAQRRHGARRLRPRACCASTPRPRPSPSTGTQ